VSCISAHDPQLARLASAIAQRVGSQRFHVWFNNSTRLDLRSDGLEIAVPNDFISEWIGRNFAAPIQDAAHEVLGCSLPVRFSVVPQLFEEGAKGGAARRGSSPPAGGNGDSPAPPSSGAPAPATALPVPRPVAPSHAPVAGPPATSMSGVTSASRLRHDLDHFITGASNQLAYNAAVYVAQYPGVQYNPLFIHGACGLGKTHLLQGLCGRFFHHHPAKRWVYMTGEDFTNDFLTAVRANKMEQFRRRTRDLDLLVIDDVHFLSGKKATQEEFLHTFNAIEALGKQVVMASDHHPKAIDEFGESLVNRFVSGMVVRIDSPHYATRCELLRTLALRRHIHLSEEIVSWIARRVVQNVRELEGAVNRIVAHVQMTGAQPDLPLVQQAMGDLDRNLVAPVKPDSIIHAVCAYFSVDDRALMSNCRQRTASLARSLAMYLVRRTARLSFPEIGIKMGKRNHSTVISACRRIDRAVEAREKLAWPTPAGERQEDACDLVQRLEEMARADG